MDQQTHAFDADSISPRSKAAGRLSVGDAITHPRLGDCTVEAIHPPNTIDVCDASGDWFRISGLALPSNARMNKG